MPEVKSEAVANLPCGAWPSPIAAEQVARGALRLSQTAFDTDGSALYWLEGRPSEGGRSVLVKHSTASQDRAANTDVNLAPVSIRSLVHEYGGGSFFTDIGKVFYVQFDDQRIYCINGSAAPIPLTPAYYSSQTHRFTDFCLDRQRNRLICVMEVHQSGGHEPENMLVSVPLLSAASDAIKEPLVLASGFDFYSTPRISPDGRLFAYLAWRHPNMPWDGCELHVAEVDSEGQLQNDRLVAGGPDCSIFQPQWSPDGRLYFISDHSGFWQPQVISDFASFQVVPLLPSNSPFNQCEFGVPMWVFGQSTYAIVSERELVFAFNRSGIWSLLKVELGFDTSGSHKYTELESPYTDFSYLTAGNGKLAMLAASACEAQSVVELDLQSNRFVTLKSSASDLPGPAYFSKPEVIEFPTDEGRTAFAFFYPPTNPSCSPLAGEKPPLIVKCHGGPTGAASSSLSLGIQYWTSRGFAVVDVNYGGSTGFGRDYRKRLNQNWGVVDVADCQNCVKYLVSKELVDPKRVAISGGSAGGYTVLCALTFTSVFTAGASHYGIGDLEALARDTHKFESRYLDNLVAPYPSGRELYVERAPLNHVEKLNCPVIFFQGLDDKVVPPNQAEAMVNALRTKGIPVAYIAYEGEAHGFRKAENIIRTIQSEQYFFTRIFEIPLDDSLGPVEIENLPC
jgi:dipeptidyl aminopeptidase/acylaminoacyl peptidase